MASLGVRLGESLEEAREAAGLDRPESDKGGNGQTKRTARIPKLEEKADIGRRRTGTSRSLNLRVVGSIPTRLTTAFKALSAR